MEVDAESPVELESDEVEVDVEAAAGCSPPDDVSVAPDDFRLLDPRSFFAQPEPLKWIVGAAMALRTSWLPHTGQLVGLASLTP